MTITNLAYSNRSSKVLAITTLQIIAGAFLLGLCAHVKVPLFFTPIPLSLQTLGVLSMGAFLGSQKGALSVMVYLMLGCAGIPLFASGTPAFTHLIGPNGGYLIGFILQAFFAGLFFEKQKTFSTIKTFLSLSSICLLQLMLGTVWLSLFVGNGNAIDLGFTPFVSGELLKVLFLTQAMRMTQ